MEEKGHSRKKDKQTCKIDSKCLHFEEKAEKMKENF